MPLARKITRHYVKLTERGLALDWEKYISVIKQQSSAVARAFSLFNSHTSCARARAHTHTHKHISRKNTTRNPHPTPISKNRHSSMFFTENGAPYEKACFGNTHRKTDVTYLQVVHSLPTPAISGSLSPRHGASSGCGWRNGLQYGG